MKDTNDTKFLALSVQFKDLKKSLCDQNGRYVDGTNGNGVISNQGNATDSNGGVRIRWKFSKPGNTETMNKNGTT